MKEELKNILTDNGLAEYIEILEKQRLDSEELLSELNQSDFEKMGITFIGDQKKMVKLFSRQSDNLPTITTVPYESAPGENEQNNRNKTEASPPNVIIQNTTDSKGSGVSAGISGVLGGIIGAVAVIVIILIIISNESWRL